MPRSGVRDRREDSSFPVGAKATCVRASRVVYLDQTCASAGKNTGPSKTAPFSMQMHVRKNQKDGQENRHEFVTRRPTFGTCISIRQKLALAVRLISPLLQRRLGAKYAVPIKFVTSSPLLFGRPKCAGGKSGPALKDTSETSGLGVTQRFGDLLDRHICLGYQ